MAAIQIGNNNKKRYNMRHNYYLTRSLLIACFCCFFGACSNDDIIGSRQEQPTEASTKHTVKMNFVGSVVGFDQQSASSKPQTRGTSTSWSDGDKIYITFYNGSVIVPGEATYSTSAGWTVSYDGNLATGSNLKCEARFFVNATFSSASLVSLNSNSEIYEDKSGTYTYNNGSLTVQASLSPKTGRIRFTGTANTKIYTTGISVYTTFSPAINTFSTSNAMITSTVASNGSTPYIYGEFSDADRNLGLVGSDYAFTRTCTEEMLKIGESGYMAIPSDASHNNWRSGLYVKASGVEFKMIPVAGYTGGFFLIGETEVTEALYNSVNGTSSTSTYPVENISYPNITAFVEKINNVTNLHFSLPSSDQWEFAAKGGNKSQNYTYSGSNTPGDVAWYSANTSSRQKVKTKAPNELGIYDMSGNVAEFVSSMYNAYYPYFYGGYYSSKESAITSTSLSYSSGYGYTSSNCKYTGVGFRLILVCP